MAERTQIMAHVYAARLCWHNPVAIHHHPSLVLLCFQQGPAELEVDRGEIRDTYRSVGCRLRTLPIRERYEWSPRRYLGLVVFSKSCCAPIPVQRGREVFNPVQRPGKALKPSKREEETLLTRNAVTVMGGFDSRDCGQGFVRDWPFRNIQEDTNGREAEFGKWHWWCRYGFSGRRHVNYAWFEVCDTQSLLSISPWLFKVCT